MGLKYLITGATGGLGSGIIEYFLSHSVPVSDFIVSSSKSASAAQFTDRGLHFTVANYTKPETLKQAFEGVENVFFVSSVAYDTPTRVKEHRNVIDAAVHANVKHIWYTSLAWGGYTSDSKIDVQQAHYQTEELLKSSGLTYTIIREGVYADAFPILINYYPESSEILLPGDGNIAFASRSELAEANAIMMLQGGYDNETVLLTGPRTVTLQDLVDTVNAATSRNVLVRKVSLEDYVVQNAASDIGGKPEAFFAKKTSWFEGVQEGDGSRVDAALGNILGRRPKDGVELVRELLRADAQYRWKQNYFK